MNNPELGNFNPQETIESIDCTTCHQVYGSNPYCARCKKIMTPEQIESLTLKDTRRGQFKRKILENKKPRS